MEDPNKRLTVEECQGKRWITEEELKEIGGHVDSLGDYLFKGAALVFPMLKLTAQVAALDGWRIESWMVRDKIVVPPIVKDGNIKSGWEFVPANTAYIIQPVKQQSLSGTGNPEGALSEARCTCGATAAGFGIHSDWCDIHSK